MFSDNQVCAHFWVNESDHCLSVCLNSFSFRQIRNTVCERDVDFMYVLIQLTDLHGFENLIGAVSFGLCL